MIPAAPPPPLAHGDAPAFVQLDAVPVSEVASLLVRDVLREPHVLMPEVLADRRMVSVHLDTTGRPLRSEVLGYLASIGVNAHDAAGSLVLSRASAAQSGSIPAPMFGGLGYSQPPEPSPWTGVQPAATFTPSLGPQISPPTPQQAPGVISLPSPAQAAVAPSPDASVGQQVGVYRPRFRSAAYLAPILAAAVPGLRMGQGTGEAASLDVLVIAGHFDDVARAMNLLPQLDVEQEQVQLVAAVYEVTTGSSSASALSIALGLLGSQLAVDPVAGPLPSLVRLTTGNLSAVFGRLAGDNRFRAVTSPSLLVRSGSEATLTSGSQVPVLGSVSYPGEGGTPVQSVEYRDSGVVLRVKPSVHGEVIDLDIQQELSSFVRTSSGVNGSPTLNRRALTNRLTLRSGEVVVLGGLKERTTERTRSGPLPFLGSRSASTTDTEVIVVLQATRLEAGRPPAAQRGRAAASSVAVP